MAELKWKMEKMCDDCPFAKAGPGAFLRSTLRPGRWKGIIRGILRGEPFWCHKTTSEAGWDEKQESYIAIRTEKFCAGALAYQAKHGVSSNYERVMRRIDAIIRPPNTQHERSAREDSRDQREEARDTGHQGSPNRHSSP